MIPKYETNQKGILKMVGDGALGLVAIGGIVLLGNTISSVIPDTFRETSNGLSNAFYADSKDSDSCEVYRMSEGESIIPTTRDIGCEYVLTREGKLIITPNAKPFELEHYFPPGYADQTD